LIARRRSRANCHRRASYPQIFLYFSTDCCWLIRLFIPKSRPQQGFAPIPKRVGEAGALKLSQASCTYTVFMTIAVTPAAPYYAVIFTSLRTDGDKGYGKMAEAMAKLAASQPGFLGIESAREGLGITVSYWESLESIAAWKQNSRHLVAQERGRDTWYEEFKVRICCVERDYGFERE
jgi:heme-degrading monooxygenase HmoA